MLILHVLLRQGDLSTLEEVTILPMGMASEFQGQDFGQVGSSNVSVVDVDDHSEF